MPFGSVFGAIVFGILGPVLGMRLLTAQTAPFRVMAASLAVMGVTVALGLLMQRAWARWLGVLAGFVFATFALESPDNVFHLTVMFASIAVSVLLALPATGRARRDPAATVPSPSAASRAVLLVASTAFVGILAAAPFAFVRPPVAPEAPISEKKDAETHGGKPGGSVTWFDFADGLKEAKSERKLIVADFYATWCGPCKMMEKRTFKDPRVLTRLRDVVPVRVDAEETAARGGLRGDKLALRYAIEIYPTLVVLDGDGHEIARNSGYLDADEFLEWIDTVIERAGTAVARS